MMLSPGTKFGAFQILSQLGVGGMGEVYLAEDTRLHRKVALKVLPAELTQNRDRLRRFEQEAQAAAALNHPNIAHIYEIGEHEGTHVIAMEYIAGETLREKIHRERTELKRLLKCLQQVAEGLSKAHAAGIVHRDLKPDNIMITRDGFAKVLDFGLAKLVEKSGPGLGQSEGSDAPTAVMQPHSVPGVVMGTVGYMSPEQAQGKTNEIDHRSDVFSFGCILFEAATGQKPFEGESIIKSLHKIVYETAPPLADYNPAAPAELQRIVRRCLAKDPEERYQTIKDVAIELKELRREMKDGANFDTTVPPPPRKIKTVGDATAEATGSTQSNAPTSISSAEYVVSGIRAHKTVALGTLVLLLIAGAGLVYALKHFVFPSKPTIAHFQNMKITRVTTEGDVESVTISPDGKYIAYSLEESCKRSLWTKHLGTGSRVQIAAPVESLAMNASAFSPDGGYVCYTRVDEQNPKGALYQVPVLGGTSKKILVNVSQPVSLSPDGKQIAFGRYHLTTTEDELLLANADGTNEHLLITVKEPDYLNGARLAWSPDGKMLALSLCTATRALASAVSVRL
jgi:eukaryotic-like serine/threonine-protein kinase